MDVEEFIAKYLEPAFRYKRQRAKELAGQDSKESLARVWARVQERIKSGDLGEDLDVDCSMAGLFLSRMADPLKLERPPQWLCEHIALCRDCSGKLGRMDHRLSHVIMVAQMPVPHKMVITNARLEFMEDIYALKAIKPEGITCDQANRYYRDMALCNLQAPAEIYRHVMNCASCTEQVQKLHSKIATAIPEPELDPAGDMSVLCGFLAWPPIALQPDEAAFDRKYAHSLRLVLPRIIASAERNRATTFASLSVQLSARANEPTVVGSSIVSILSLIKIGIPNKGPIEAPFSIFASCCSATLCASGLTLIMARKDGLDSSIRA